MILPVVVFLQADCLTWAAIKSVLVYVWLFLQITSGMVISTFVSAPIMYVSAWLLTIPSMDPNPLTSALQNVSFDISIVSLVSLVGAGKVKYKSTWSCQGSVSTHAANPVMVRWDLRFVIVFCCRRMRKKLKIILI